jgi:hypothetical protein
MEYFFFLIPKGQEKNFFNLNAQAASLFTTELLVTIKKSSAVFLI